MREKEGKMNMTGGDKVLEKPTNLEGHTHIHTVCMDCMLWEDLHHACVTMHYYRIHP